MKEMLNKKLSILVCSCDAYSDVWDPFFNLLNKYFNHKPDIDIILCTESKNYNSNGIAFNIKTFNLYPKRNVTYGKRIISHIKKIKTDFTLVLMEDFFIRKPIDFHFIEKVITYFDQDKKAACFSFEHSFDSLDYPSSFPEFLKRPKYAFYKLNFQAAIWRTKCLKRLWKKHETPWMWEDVGNFRTFNNRYHFYSLKNNIPSPIDYGYEIGGSGILGGRWNAINVVQLFENEGINVDFGKRGFTGKKTLSPAQKQKYSHIKTELKYTRSMGLLLYLRVLFVRLQYSRNSKEKDSLHFFVKHERDKKFKKYNKQSN